MSEEISKKAHTAFVTLLPTDKLGDILDNSRLNFLETLKEITANETGITPELADKFSKSAINFNDNSVDQAIFNIIKDIPINKLINVVTTLISESVKSQLKADRIKCVMSLAVAYKLSGLPVEFILTDMATFVKEKKHREE